MHFLFIFLFSFPLFAYDYITNDHTCPSGPAVLTASSSDSSIYVKTDAQYAYMIVPHYACTSSGYTVYTTTGISSDAYYYYGTSVIKTYTYVTACPAGQIQNSDGVCVPPVTCTWATPPWFPVNETGYNATSCTPLNTNGLFANNTPNYISDTSWCASESKCYARSGSCPVGQIYNKSTSKCYYPSGDQNKCPDGYITRNWSTGIDDLTKTCWTDRICKSNPSIKQTYQVSCGVSPDQTTPADGADGPQTPQIAPDSTKKPVGGSGGTSSDCISANFNARSACIPPNVLTFSCNPTTGEVIKSSCDSPTAPTQTPVNSGDDTKAATTGDIKNLTNTLPTAIKEALSSYLTDGSYSHLEAIRGSLESNTILHADTNDKLDSISASSDASLVLQSDANTKLDEIKDSLTAGGTYTGDGVPTEAELTPDAETASGYDVFNNSITSVQNQFEQAKNIFDTGLPVPAFTGGSCPSYTFYGNNVSLNKVGQAISPYSSIFAILIYISSVIASFRLVINFLSRGV